MSTTTHVRIYWEDKRKLVQLAAQLGASIPDMLHQLLESYINAKAGQQEQGLQKLERRIMDEIDRLDNVILRDREYLEYVKEWIGQISARLTEVEKMLGIQRESTFSRLLKRKE